MTCNSFRDNFWFIFLIFVDIRMNFIKQYFISEPVGSSQPSFRLTPVGAVVEIVSTVTVAAVVAMIIVVVVVVWLR